MMSDKFESINLSHIRWACMRELKSKHRFSDIFLMLYRYKTIRKYLVRLVLQLEGGKFFSQTIRMILEKYHDVKVGAYSYGSCLLPGVLPHGTIVGRYCSFAENLKVYRRNHRLDTLSQHPFFYNHSAGLIATDGIQSVQDNPLVIGHDVWMGANVIVLPGCDSIGNGAVVGAGSVITKNVPPYAIMGGNPAKLIRYRYLPEVIKHIEKTQWWHLKLADLLSTTDLPFNNVTIDALKSSQFYKPKENNNEQANIYHY